MASDPIKVAAEVGQDVRDALFGAMADYGSELTKELRQSISTKYPPASSPGNPPHRRTGKLHASASTDTNERGQTVITTVGTNAPYAGFLEEGTSRMAARPHIDPLHRKALAEAAARVTENLPTII